MTWDFFNKGFLVQLMNLLKPPILADNLEMVCYPHIVAAAFCELPHVLHNRSIYFIDSNGYWLSTHISAETEQKPFYTTLASSRTGCFIPPKRAE
jgi:hypothetical protein